MDLIVAPCDGVIRDLQSYRVGAKISKGTVVCYVYDENIKLLSIQASNLRYGMQVQVVTGTNKDQLTLPGRVVVGSGEVPGTNSAYALIEVDVTGVTSTPTWKKNKITYNTTDLQNVLLIDADCVILESGSHYVQKLAEDGSVQKRSVMIGLSNRDKAWVIQGLNEGETVIIP